MYKRTIAISVIISILLSGQALAFGELTHYSVNRDAGKNTIADVSAASAPDAFFDIFYGANGLDAFVHAELPGVLYDPLGFYINSNWNNGWMGHTISDRASHGTLLPNSKYLNPNNYLSAVGATTLLDHYKAEFAGDILSYWYKQGTLPKSLIIYPNQIGDALKSYDNNCGTTYSSQFDPQNYLKSYDALYASTYAEQALIDYKLDRNLEFSDYILLNWAKNKYSIAFNKYYNYAVLDVENLNNINPIKTCLPKTTISTIDKNIYQPSKMKIDIGKQLIDKGLIKVNEKVDKKTGAVTISLEQTVNFDQLIKEYESTVEDIHEKHTGKKIKILQEILSDK